MRGSGIEETVKIPEGLEANLKGREVQVSGPNGELSKDFDFRGVDIRMEGDKMVIRTESTRREHRAAVGTIVSQLENMFNGAKRDFVSKLKVVYSHFPISVNVRDGRVEIENFIGEETPRVAEIVGDTEVNVKVEEIEVRGPSKEEVGQTAANIEQATRTQNRDPRVFQDGIYIVERP